MSDGMVIAGGGLAAQRAAETATYTRDGLPVAALLVDRTRALPAMRKLISHGGAR